MIVASSGADIVRVTHQLRGVHTRFRRAGHRALVHAPGHLQPNVYQQMIGRGLRGPANNGKEVCLVVDVADNVAAYGLELVFGEFEYMWQ